MERSVEKQLVLETRCKTIATKKLFNKHNLLSVKDKDIIKFTTVLIFPM